MKQMREGKAMQRLAGLMRKAVQDYEMLAPGDRVLIGVSGGKDSVALTVGLALLREYIGFDYQLQAVTLDPQFGGVPGDYAPLADLMARYGVPYQVRRTDIGPVIFDQRREKNPCALCAKMRRGILHNMCLELGLTKLALGHHFDDALQTFFLNLLYGGRIGCFSPKTYLSRKKITVIRPLIFCEEGRINGAVRRMDLPVVKSACPADGVTAREDASQLIRQLEKQYPDLRKKVLGAMQRAGLDGW